MPDRQIQPSTAAKIERVKKAAVKTVMVTLIAVNAAVLLPGAVFSVITGDYPPTITVIAMSLGVWAAGYGFVRGFRARRASDERTRRSPNRLTTKEIGHA